MKVHAGIIVVVLLLGALKALKIYNNYSTRMHTCTVTNTHRKLAKSIHTIMQLD